MNLEKPFKFTLVEYASFEEALRMTPEERIRQNNIMANRLLELEAFMIKFCRGYNFLKSQHVNLS
jgi:hypothetical protein